MNPFYFFRDQLLKLDHYKLIGYSRRNPRIIRLDNYKALYFVIPKVGCSSLKKFCVDMLNITPEPDIHKTIFPTLRYDRLFLFKDYFKFAFVRNPWDRLLSFYKNKIEPGERDQIEKYKYYPKGISFEKFVEIVSQISDDDPYMNWHYQSQYRILYNDKDELMVDFVGKLETINDDFKKVLSLIGIDDYTLPKKNTTKHSHYREYYSDKTKDLVYKRYYEDIKRFKYEF